MRAHRLLAPQRTRGRRKPRPNNGTIVPDAPDVMWGTDTTMAYTLEGGWVWLFAAIDHYTAEVWTRVAVRGDRFDVARQFRSILVSSERRLAREASRLAAVVMVGQQLWAVAASEGARATGTAGRVGR
jgi:putative transposase